jgi:competence protein ComEA
MSKFSINPGFFLRYFIAPALAVATLAAPLSAHASDTGLSELREVSISPFMASKQLQGKVNINTASAPQLEMLPGIGPSTAAKIIAYRAKYPFKQTLHLLRVKGVGRKTFDKIKPFLTVEGGTDLQVVK